MQIDAVASVKKLDNAEKPEKSVSILDTWYYRARSPPDVRSKVRGITGAALVAYVEAPTTLAANRLLPGASGAADVFPPSPEGVASREAVLAFPSGEPCVLAALDAPRRWIEPDRVGDDGEDGAVDAGALIEDAVRSRWVSVEDRDDDPTEAGVADAIRAASACS